jgi:hypothetical protein
MSNFYSSHNDRRTRLAVLMTAATLACVALAGPAAADAGDRDLEVNAINTAPNLLAPRTEPAAAVHAGEMKAHGMAATSGHAMAKAHTRRY